MRSVVGWHFEYIHVKMRAKLGEAGQCQQFQFFIMRLFQETEHYWKNSAIGDSFTVFGVVSAKRKHFLEKSVSIFGDFKQRRRKQSNLPIHCADLQALWN